MGFAFRACVLSWDGLLYFNADINAFSTEWGLKPNVTCNGTLLGHCCDMPCADDLVRDAERDSLDLPCAWVRTP